MIIGVPSEISENERRVALTPPLAEQFVNEGHDVWVASGAGEDSDWCDSQYRNAGCTILDKRSDVLEQADILLQVRGLGTDEYREGQIVIGLLDPYNLDDELEHLIDQNITAFALELMPRISRAQSMDVLSSMASLSGYKAAVMAASELPKMFPMEMTAAGTVQPANVFVIGAGVAGLKAIATSERLGASVRGYDIRLEVKQEVESLGANFVELDLETEGSGDNEGYAREMDDEFYRQQRKELTRVVGESDVVITTAAIPGRPAPELVTSKMVNMMEPGSVIIDLAAQTGGNCELTQTDEIVQVNGVKIFGPTNLPATVSHHASQLYGSNVTNFLQYILHDGTPTIDADDEIIDSTMLSHKGELLWKHSDSSEENANDSDLEEDDE